MRSLTILLASIVTFATLAAAAPAARADSACLTPLVDWVNERTMADRELDGTATLIIDSGDWVGTSRTVTPLRFRPAGAGLVETTFHFAFSSHWFARPGAEHQFFDERQATGVYVSLGGGGVFLEMRLWGYSYVATNPICINEHTAAFRIGQATLILALHPVSDEIVLY